MTFVLVVVGVLTILWALRGDMGETKAHCIKQHKWVVRFAPEAVGPSRGYLLCK